MSATAATAVQGRTASAASAGRWPALAFTVIVAVAAAYAFSPRPTPPFAPTAVHPDGLLVTGLARSGTRLLAVGEQGRILVADDARGPWHEATVEPQRGSTLTQVKFIDDKTAIAVGHDGWILRSSDGGESWNETFFIESPKPDAAADAGLAPPADAGFSVEPPADDAGAAPAASAWTPPPLQPDPLLGIAGPFDGRLFAYGGFGLMLSSTDAGQSWQRVSAEAISDHHLYGIVRATDRSLIVVGERGLMARSGDDGQSWSKLPSVYDGSFFGALVLPSKALLAYGMRGNVYRSDDDGKTWQKSTTPVSSSLFGGNVSPRGEIVLVGAGSVILVSNDDGRSFTQPLPGNPHDLAAVLPLTSSNLLTAGDGGLELTQIGGVAEGAQP
ncbi:WD40/YVTN/BNR-like repeat-containing protein [Solimonas variicoloris]|uniref:WD40/YVTN/BNR-like repeat-containing protein n=1 Tax=Solimonas variicoloris TaxID=254408 RepID=UPI0003785445|nr:YCF48-related protein [Solimonas variicoloris]